MLILRSQIVHAQGAERSALEVETAQEDMEDAPKIEETQTDANIDAETIEIIANEPSDKIKDENIEKCDKCLKSTFRYRHDGFCGKCVSNNIIDVNEQQAINDAMRCKKCRKPKFRSRHLLFCIDNCNAAEITSTTRKPSTSTTTKATTTRRTTTEKWTTANYENMKKFKNREEKQRRREQKRREKQKRKELKQKRKKEGVRDEDPDAVKLGPLGNVLKYLIVANTWEDN